MSLREKFTGTGIAIVTPFHTDGKIDWDSYKKLIEFWIANEMDAGYCAKYLFVFDGQRSGLTPNTLSSCAMSLSNSPAIKSRSISMHSTSG